jgi:exonuclease III
MKILFWNVRGLGKSYRRNWVKNHILAEDLDVVAIQETIKQDFTDFELKELASNNDFCWLWVPPRGHSGGLITGIKVDDFDIEHSITGTYFLAVLLRTERPTIGFGF